MHVLCFQFLNFHGRHSLKVLEQGPQGHWRNLWGVNGRVDVGCVRVFCFDGTHGKVARKMRKPLQHPGDYVLIPLLNKLYLTACVSTLM